MPQFLNVIRGEMSVVGPRPPLRREVEAYDGRVKRRLLVRPGVTGLWQVSGRSDLSWDESVRLDLSYVENWSMVSDVLIIGKTVTIETRRTPSFCRSTSIPRAPPRVIEPESASCSVAIVRISVDFPAPFGPRRPNMPVGMVRLTLRSACTPFG